MPDKVLPKSRPHMHALRVAVRQSLGSRLASLAACVFRHARRPALVGILTLLHACVSLCADLTLANDRSFWSSCGHPSSVAHEALLYELMGPACRVVSIKLAPYRALYQDG